MTALTNQAEALSLQLCISWLSGSEWKAPGAGLCLAAPGPGRAVMDELTGAELHERSLV